MYLFPIIFPLPSYILPASSCSQLIPTNKLTTHYLKYNGEKVVGYSGQLIYRILSKHICEWCLLCILPHINTLPTRIKIIKIEIKLKKSIESIQRPLEHTRHRMKQIYPVLNYSEYCLWNVSHHIKFLKLIFLKLHKTFLYWSSAIILCVPVYRLLQEAIKSRVGPRPNMHLGPYSKSCQKILIFLMN